LRDFSWETRISGVRRLAVAFRLPSHAWNQAASTLSVSTNRFHDSPVVETDNDWLRTCRTEVCSPSAKHGWRSRMRSSSFDPTVRTIWLVRGICQKRRPETAWIPASNPLPHDEGSLQSGVTILR
jgi:hypothetical protein